MAMDTMQTVSPIDRFTTRCRLPAIRMRARLPHMSQYVLVRAGAPSATDTKDTLFVCRAAVLQQQDNGNRHNWDDAACSWIGPLCFDASVRLTARPSLYRDLGGNDLGFTSDTSCASLQWIPKTRIVNAVAVTLEALATPVDTTNVTDNSNSAQSLQQPLLANIEYKQMLIETLQRHVLLCRGAVVQLPAPSRQALHSAAAASTTSSVVAFRVVSMYPDADFVRVSSTTRVTLTAAAAATTTATDNSVATAASGSTTRKPIKIGGLEREQQALCDMIVLPVQHATLAADCGLAFPNGLLLCGPPGVGKTLLVRAVVRDCRMRVPLQLATINGAEIVTGGVGDAETTLRRAFADAAAFARQTRGAAVVFIDELDALCPTRSGGSDAHSRIVAQLLTLLDGADARARGHVVVVGATNLPNAIDPALRRPGRFDRELFIGAPDAAARAKIFATCTQDLPIGFDSTSDSDVDSEAELTARAAFNEALARDAIGFVGADIAALCREALAVATTRHVVALARDRELDVWWRDWQRRAEPLATAATLSAVVAGNAWTANPIAMPLWFVRKQQQQQQRDGSSQSDRVFSFLLQRNDDSNSTSSSKSSDSADGDSELASVVLTAPRLDASAFRVTMADFAQAMQVVGASSLRGATGFSKDFERLGWDSIGGQDATKLALQQALEWPIKYPQTFTRLGVKPPRGILLYGPPGCSKSTIVRAAAHASGATFLTLSAAKVFSPFVGDAEAAVRQVFRDARAALPAIVFFDEIDVLVAKRAFDGGSDDDAGSTSALRVMSTMLNEMDGVESADGLLVIGATNRPDCIDAALLRPGRFDRILYVDLPTERDRVAILEIHSARMQLASDVDLAAIAARTQLFSGAELENVCREAALRALRESIRAECVHSRHFEDALAAMAPGATPQTLAQYRAFAHKMGHAHPSA